MTARKPAEEVYSRRTARNHPVAPSRAMGNQCRRCLGRNLGNGACRSRRRCDHAFLRGDVRCDVARRGGDVMFANEITPRPRTGPILDDAPLAVVPAIAALARCKNGIDAMKIYLEIPNELLPQVTWYSAQRGHVKPSIIRDLIKMTGRHRLIDALGSKQARNLFARFS